MGDKLRSIQKWQVVACVMALYDMVAVCVSWLGALIVRFDFHFSAIDPDFFRRWRNFTPVYIIVFLTVFLGLRLYSSIWQFASYVELTHLMMGNIITCIFHIAGITLLQGRMPISYYLMGSVFQMVLTAVVRFGYRFWLLERKRIGASVSDKTPRIMIVGAGVAGQMLARDINRDPQENGLLRCFIDDDPNKKGRFIEGAPVAGGRDQIPEKAAEYGIDRIYLAMPSATPSERKEILDICRDTGCMLRQMPGVNQLVNGEVTVSQMREVSVEDLLGRDPITIDLQEVFSYISGKTVLVTGGGGSIGSELCRQIAKHGPGQLIILDVYENNAYAIEQELRRNCPSLNLVVLIGSVRDSRRIDHVFRTYHPDIVYHAAAHKHVPLMEESPGEAVKNNVFGTYKTAYAAMASGCERFVLISTDKAVNPTNVMGASKRLCEMIIQTFDYMIRSGRQSELPQIYSHAELGNGDGMMSLPEGAAARTRFSAVRFGNVLGSNGSVIPLFRSQIESGGPVTVTHPDIIRYFMTIPEAVSLVLQASVMGKGSEIFVLDMGSPVRIDDLARTLIRLSGFRPDEDIPIVYTGLRPGEKLFEEKLMAEEGLEKTSNKLIHIGRPVDFDYEWFLENLGSLLEAACEDESEIRSMLRRMVNTYHPELAGEVK